MWKKLLLLSVAVAPLFAQVPSVFIDGPTQGASVTGTITVSGWAIDNTQNIGTPITSVIVKVDGITMGAATMGISRPDVCQAYPGRPGCPNVGYAFALNTASLTSGNHSLQVFATDSDAVPQTGSASVVISVANAASLSSPVVAIDSPTSGSVVSGTITVTGWALDSAAGVGTAISSVRVLVDGVAAGTATYGLPRPDACVQFPGRPGCPNVGFSFSLNTANYSQGSHVITVSATDSDPSPDSGSATTTVTIGTPPSVMIDSVTPGAVVSNILTVSGWAIDNATGIGTAISSVQIQVDGQIVGNANYGVARADVCAVYPGRPGCPNVGFTFLLDTKTLTPGIHTVTALATDSDVPASTASWTTNFSTTTPPTVTIESPAAGASVSGSVTVVGWALDNNNASPSAISSVKLAVDGNYVGPAIYGLPRAEICGIYFDRPGCPNVGFIFYDLDLSLLAAGPHTITVTATDSDLVPDSNSSSVTVNVVPGHAFSLEAPLSGVTATGFLPVSGYANPGAGTYLSAINIDVDGTRVGTATYGGSRPDICALAAGTNCPNIGFNYSLDTSLLSVGPHQLTVTAASSNGGPPIGAATATINVAR